MEYKPILESIYIISRSFNNETKSWDIWSAPRVFESIKYNEINKIRDLIRSFNNPIPVSDKFGESQVVFNGNIILNFPTERTQVKICLPAGTILKTFNL